MALDLVILRTYLFLLHWEIYLRRTATACGAEDSSSAEEGSWIDESGSRGLGGLLCKLLDYATQPKRPVC